MNTTKDGPWIIISGDPDQSVQIRSDVDTNKELRDKKPLMQHGYGDRENEQFIVK